MLPDPNTQQRELFGIHTRFPFDLLGQRLGTPLPCPLTPLPSAIRITLRQVRDTLQQAVPSWRTPENRCRAKIEKFFSISRIRTFFFTPAPSLRRLHSTALSGRPLSQKQSRRVKRHAANTGILYYSIYYSIIPKRIPRTAAHFMNRPATRHSDGGTGRQRYGGLYERPDGNRTRSMAAER